MRIALFVTLLLAPPALAQDFEAAARHFGAAQDAFGKQHFHAAATEFERAYDITKDPVLLYNIGEAWQKAGEGKKAVVSYKAYLKANANAQDRADVQKRIRSIEQKKLKIADQSAPGDVIPPLVAEAPPQPSPAPVVTAKQETLTPDFDAPAPSPAPAQVAVEPAPVAPVPVAAPPPPAAVAEKPEKPAEPSGGLLEDQPVSKMRVAAWICVAGTVAVLTAGAIFALSAQARADEISRRFNFVDSTGQPRPFDAMAQNDYNNLKSDGQLYNSLGIGFFSAAGALAVVTTVLFVVDAKRPQKRAWNLAPNVSPKQAGVALGWSF
jgi:hypothetical protein